MHLRLRSDVQADPGPEGVVFTDPLLRRRLNLGAVQDVLDQLDGRPASALEDARTIAVVRTLLLLNLLEGAGEPVRATLRASHQGEPLPVTTLPGAAFACQGSGGCCRNYVFGPLTDADVARVEALDLSGFDLPSGAPFYESGPNGRFLRTREGRCVFLDEQARCGLHARHGGRSKPGFCQLFPLVAWATPSGVRVYDNGECVRFPDSATGEPVRAAWESIRDLVPIAVQNPLVHLAPGAPCDLGWWLPVQDRLAAVVRTAPPAATLRALGAALAAYTAALRRCPLSETGPADALAALDGTDWYAAPGPAASADEGRAAIVSIAHALEGIFASSRAPFTEDMLAALRRLATDVARGTPLPADPRHDGMWGLAYTQRMFGQRALIDGRPRPALLRACFDWLLARASGDERSGHTLASRRLDMPWAPLHQLFTRAEAALDPVMVALDRV